MIFLSIMAFALSSCNKETVEYRQTDGDCKFVIKTIDGKRQWGMADARDNREYIPCQYDSIFSAYGEPYNIAKLFIALKDGKMYAWTYRGDQLLDGRGFTSLVSSSQDSPHNSSVYGGPIFHEAQTDEGIMFFRLPTGITWLEIGPAEALFWGESRILCKKDGKWAVLDGRKGNHFSPITPYSYEAVISVNHKYFWVKQDGKWSAIDADGNVINPTTASRPGKRCRSKKSPVSPPTKRLASVTKIDSTTVETTLVLYRGLVMISRYRPSPLSEDTEAGISLTTGSTKNAASTTRAGSR